MNDNDLRQEWEEIHFCAVGLWRHLCRWDYRKAAKGLLQDLLKELHDAEDPTIDDPALGGHLPDGSAIRDHLIAEYRERLMQVLDDADGQKLKKWQQLYREYRYEGKDHELEAFLQSAFLQEAGRLVVATASHLQADADIDTADRCCRQTLPSRRSRPGRRSSTPIYESGDFTDGRQRAGNHPPRG
jgi:hypothetical protein